MEFFGLIIGVLCGIWCLNIFDNNGRTGWIGFLIGFCFGLFGVAFCYLLGQKK